MVGRLYNQSILCFRYMLGNGCGIIHQPKKGLYQIQATPTSLASYLYQMPQRGGSLDLGYSLSGLEVNAKRSEGNIIILQNVQEENIF